jgi:hypothetical protein
MRERTSPVSRLAGVCEVGRDDESVMADPEDMDAFEALVQPLIHNRYSRTARTLAWRIGYRIRWVSRQAWEGCIACGSLIHGPYNDPS